jgi:sugar phosphate isomerase/epimerase
MKLGAQLFSLRNFIKTPEDILTTFEKIKAMGFENVQFSGGGPIDAHELKAISEKTGLPIVCTHSAFDRILNDTDALIEEHKIFGCQHIGLGYFDFKKVPPEEAYPAFLEQFKPVAKTIRENGLYFMYHNHDAEFKKLDGQILLDRIAQDFSPEELGIIVDTYWVQKGGANPAEYIRKLSGRVPCIHLKDYAYDAVMAVVGEGNINFDAVISAAEDAGTRYLLVEQDNCNGEDPFDCLKRSYENLRAMGLQ